MKIKTDELRNNSILLFAFSIVTGLVNYAFQIVIGNLLTPAEYGTVNPLLSLISIFAVPSGIISVLSSKYTTEYTTLDRPRSVASLLKGLMRVSCVFAGILLVLGILLAKPLAAMLNIENSLYVAACFAAAAIGYLYPALNGALQGKKMFVAYGISGLITSVGRIAFSTVFILLGARVLGVTAALALTSLFILCFCFFMLRKTFLLPDDGSFKTDRPLLLSYMKSVIVVQVLIAVLTYGDILLIKAFIDDPVQTGVYSSGLIFGRIPIYLSGAIAAVMFPMVSEKAAKGKGSISLLLRSLAYSAGTGVLFSAGLILFGRLALQFTFGDKYLAATEMFLPICCYTVTVSLITVVVQYLQALGRTKALSVIMSIGFVAAYISVRFFHSSIPQILYALSACLAAVFAATLAFTLTYGRATELSTAQSVGENNEE